MKNLNLLLDLTSYAARSAIAVCIASLLITANIRSQGDPRSASAETDKWRQDLRYMADEMPKRHKNLFHSMAQADFNAAVERLDKRIPSLDRNQIIVEFMRIVAMAGKGDGHTSIHPSFNPRLGFRYLPVQIYRFSDGLFIRAAAKEYENAVGARVLKIGNVSAEEAFKMASEISPRDNDLTLSHRVPGLLTIAEVLAGLRIADSPEKITFVLEKDGKNISIDLAPAGNVPQRSHDGTPVKDPADDWVAMNARSSTPVPLWLRAPRDNYWFEYLPATRTVYTQYNSVMNKDGESIAAFARRLFEFVDANPVERFVLDIRMNEGGNSYFNMPLLLGIIRASKINRRGHLFVITGRGTFSAAQNLANELERYTNALFVGEPTGGSVHFYGDHDLLILPNSRIGVAVSTLWWQTLDPRDARPWIAPAIDATLSSADFRDNRDPAMDAIMNYRSIAGALEPAITGADPGRLAKAYNDFKNDPKTRGINTESEVNSLGYQALNKGKTDLAIQLFKLNADSYPASANVYDSLGDAYAKAGSKDLAVTSYRRALEIAPKNDFTAHKLSQLLQQPPPHQ